MATTAEDVIGETQRLAVDENLGKEEVNRENEAKAIEEGVAMEIEPKTGVSFPVKLDDGKQLSCVGLRKKSMLGIGIKIHGFGIIFPSNVFYLLQILRNHYDKHFNLQGYMWTTRN